MVSQTLYQQYFFAAFHITSPQSKTKSKNNNLPTQNPLLLHSSQIQPKLTSLSPHPMHQPILSSFTHPDPPPTPIRQNNARINNFPDHSHGLSGFARNTAVAGRGKRWRKTARRPRIKGAGGRAIPPGLDPKDFRWALLNLASIVAAAAGRKSLTWRERRYAIAAEAAARGETA